MYDKLKQTAIVAYFHHRILSFLLKNSQIDPNLPFHAALRRSSRSFLLLSELYTQTCTEFAHSAK